MKTLWLKKGEDRRIRAGHLWIFSNEIDSAKSPLPDFEPGENATLRDARGAVLGSVFVNPHSLICARLYSRKADLPLDADLLRQRLQSALGLRQRLYNQPWYRLCHGEGDLLPGLVMDRFGDHLTVQVGTWGMEARKEELREVLGELLQPRSILWDNDIAARSLEGLPRENESEGPVPDVLEVPENGCIFRAPLQGGQKTGWFYDQRRNRREAARYAAVLDGLEKTFGPHAEAGLYSAPGRTEIGGNHTDHNNGRVLAAAVNLDTIACVSRTDDNAIVVDSEGFAPITVELDNLDIREKDFGTTLALIRGTAGIMKEMGYKIGGFRATISSSVLRGSGLSSSAAFEVLIAAILDHLND